ncbi:sulfate adenylyltransferase subunit 1 [Lactococcus insecticola]|uniref:sulfate adenylyltransferase n=1 Tax=Pseudolactococcus insecticola TaxID=2709158 RepID=A0A6A0B5E5_9LACT|nr:GTP-binding protein [Lactococcus insecticola]GFH39925.1 hypothetical protein Hs20B_03230 [Lactococcus insecticola]
MSKKSLSLVVVGHVDHGKSTVIGRLLHDTHSLPQGTIDKVKKIAKETGKPFEYAYLLDAFEEEQQQGITIDTTQIQFQTDNREYVIIDAPGHVEFLKNMISGAANAEAAFLIVDVKKGVEEQTKRHAYMLKLLGIKKVYAIFNKMDLVDYEQARFEAVKADLIDFLTPLNLTVLDFVPVSAFFGENILEQTGIMPWYQGLTLIALLDSIDNDTSLSEQALRFPIQDVYKFDDRRIIAGRIESGILRKGDEIQIFPDGRKTVVESFTTWHETGEKTVAYPGESIGITVRDEFFNNRGEVITHAVTPPLVSNAFLANLFWMGKTPLVKGKRYKIKLATQEVYATVATIEKVLDASTLSQFEDAQVVNINDVAEVVFNLEKTIVFDSFKDFDVTGRFVVIDGFDVSGGGTIAEKREIAEASLTGVHFATDTKVVGVHAFDAYNIALGGNITRQASNQLYHIGDAVAISSETYQYPETFDIAVVSERLVIQIRHGQFAALTALDDYIEENKTQSDYTVVNSDGFAIKLAQASDLTDFITDYQYLDGKNKATFYNKWLQFDTYRKLPFSDNYDMI